MKGTIVSLIVLVALVVPAAGAAPQARDPRVPSLQRRVAVLESQQRTLREADADLAEAVVQLAQAVTSLNDKDTCGMAITFDVFRALFLGLGGGDIGRFDDRGACSRLGINRP